MKKYFLSISAVVIAVLLVAFTQPKKAMFDPIYFQYSEDDISFNNLKDPAHWQLISLPATGCDEGSIPCVVKIEGLSDYGGSYSPGYVDEVDFARYLDLQGETNAQAYVTGVNMEASKD
ncbi:hypothetical protein WG954_05785 [Lacibacter sp. H375]|uniref:hypothetical protein n=1 Tax=Lacibacter sp. H375 TaxID=3133424 RepID=UPI0030C5FF65